MKKLLSAFVLAAVSLLPANAQPKGPRPDFFAELNLTDKQKKDVDAIHAKHKATMEAKRTAMDAARKSGDEAKIKEARKAMREQMHVVMNECQTILTAEQKAKMEQIRASRPKPKHED